MAMNHDLVLKPGYYAVLFISERDDHPDGYAAMDEATINAVSALPGFIGWESARESPTGFFVSYWESVEAIHVWRDHGLHKEAKAEGRNRWYHAYRTVVCRIEDTHHFKRAV